MASGQLSVASDQWQGSGSSQWTSGVKDRDYKEMGEN
jgi:hypothetical protein